MILFKNSAALSRYIKQRNKEQVQIGFVPTMGALHQGHISLIEQSKKENDVTVCSIFINPAQFNNHSDFNFYPVTIEKDLEALLAVHCDILFLPVVSEIYPIDYKAKLYDLGNLETILEGKYRPGHFQGVCQVVDILLETVAPHRLYLGQKDYQQCMVVQRLLQLTGRKDTSLHKIATKRENGGLAMSSRNLRLSPEQREKASEIYKTLSYIKDNFWKKPSDTLQKEAVEKLVQAGFSVDYVSIADALTLKENLDKEGKKIALVAATLGQIRLIDNLLLN